MNLYEIDEKLQDLIDLAVDPTTGEIDPEVEKELDALQMQREKKLESYAMVIKSKNHFIDSCKAEIDRLKSMINREQKTIGYLEERLTDALDYQPLKTTAVTVTFTKSERVETEPDFDISKFAQKHEIFVRTKIQRDLDKTGIKKAIKSGMEFKGVKIVSSKKIKVK